MQGTECDGMPISGESQSDIAPQAAKLGDLGAFLRSRRHLLAPKQVGFEPSPRRKAAGLRREEVAALAGISDSWYTRIELGSAGMPSAETMYAIAQALRLDPSDTRYVFELAGLAIPHYARQQGVALSPAVGHVIANLGDAPTTVFDWYCTPYYWNAAADGIFRWSKRDDPFERNMIVSGLSDSYYRDLCGSDEEYEKVARSIIGTFRRTFTTFGPMPLTQRIFEFGMTNPLFRAIWNESHVAEAFTDPGPILRHVPGVGALHFDYVDLVPAGQTSVLIRVLSPRDEETRAKLPILETLGTEKRFTAEA